MTPISGACQPLIFGAPQTFRTPAARLALAPDNWRRALGGGSTGDGTTASSPPAYKGRAPDEAASVGPGGAGSAGPHVRLCLFHAARLFMCGNIGSWSCH